MKFEGVDHFVSDEFDSPDMKGSGCFMDVDFVKKLDQLRKAVGFPLVINSGYRTQKHNAKVGGVPDSAHTTRHAADIRANTSRTRFLIVKHALDMGFRRVGIAKTFVHLDDDPDLPQDMFWLY